MKKAAKIIGIILNIMFAFCVFIAALVLYENIVVLAGDQAAIDSLSQRLVIGNLTCSLRPEVVNPFGLKISVLTVTASLTAIITACLQLYFLKDICSFIRDGIPFAAKVEKNFLLLAIIRFAGGLTVSIMSAIKDIYVNDAIDLTFIFSEEAVSNYYMLTSFDAGFIYTAAVYLLLYFIFRYGRELQQLSDETL